MNSELLKQLQTNERAYAFWPEEMKAAWEEVPAEWREILWENEGWRTLYGDHQCKAYVYRVSPAYNPPAAKTGIRWEPVYFHNGQWKFDGPTGPTRLHKAFTVGAIGFRSDKYGVAWTGGPVIYRIVDRTTGVSSDVPGCGLSDGSGREARPAPI